MATAKDSTESASDNSTDSSSNVLTLSERPLSKEEMIKRGEEAATILNSTAYNLAHRSLIQKYQDQILESDPQERNLREHMYNMMRAASDVAHQLAEYVNEAQQLNLEVLREEEANQRAVDENRGF